MGTPQCPVVRPVPVRSARGNKGGRRYPLQRRIRLIIRSELTPDRRIIPKPQVIQDSRSSTPAMSAFGARGSRQPSLPEILSRRSPGPCRHPPERIGTDERFLCPGIGSHRNGADHGRRSHDRRSTIDSTRPGIMIDDICHDENVAGTL